MVDPAKPILVSIVGPTAVGKTDLALRVAERYQTEILSADSRQMFRRLDIGTAKPQPEQLARIPHHLIDWLEPEESLSVGRFLRKAQTVLEALFANHRLVVVVGGSTLYMQALWEGINDMPPVPDSIRQALQETFQEHGLAPLLAELQTVDPETYAKIDRNNQARVLRALEVYRASGQSMSALRQAPTSPPGPWQQIKIALTDDRPALYQRIESRVETMVEKGLFEEVKALLASGLAPDSQALRSIGYQEIVDHLAGIYDREEAIRLIKRNSRRYAKRQLTWYRRFPDLTWFEAGAPAKVLSWLEQQVPVIP